jgi:hypothetical protein
MIFLITKQCDFYKNKIDQDYHDGSKVDPKINHNRELYTHA